MSPKGSSQAYPRDLSLEDVYNLLMAEIEPDLTTMMIPYLDEVYEGETEKEHKERGGRYARAFEEFSKRFEKAMGIWKAQFLKLKEAALNLAKKKTGKEEADRIADIERSLEET